MNKTFLYSCCIGLVFLCGSTLIAERVSAQQRAGLLGRKQKCCEQCPSCAAEYCELKCEQGEVSKTCFEVDYKTICIPKVNWPWKKNCEPACAETRSVKILKKKTYKCPKCKCKWEVVKPEIIQAESMEIGQSEIMVESQLLPLAGTIRKAPAQMTSQAIRQSESNQRRTVPTTIVIDPDMGSSDVPASLQVPKAPLVGEGIDSLFDEK